MPNTKSKRKRSESPRSVASNTSSTSEFAEEILKNPNNQPLPYDTETMSKAVKNFSSPELIEVYEKFQNENSLTNHNNKPLDPSRETMRKAVSNLKPSTVKSIYNELQNTGGKKKKRITIKKKKARKSLKKPMFKRKSAKHK